MKNSTYKELTPEAYQVILTGVVGDGSISKSSFSTACVFKEYIEFKKNLLGELSSEIRCVLNHGYKINPIYSIRTRVHPTITKIASNSLTTNLSKLTDLGLAMWFYDDGSLHKNNHCYNLCTHAFSYEEHVDVIIPFLQNYLNIKVKLAQETKKDGRHFYYCRVNKSTGANVVSELLGNYPINCYDYKRLENLVQFEWYEDEIYIVDKGHTIGRILDKQNENYYVVFDDDEVRVPEHTLNAAKMYVRQNYKNHKPL